MVSLAAVDLDVRWKGEPSPCRTHDPVGEADVTSDTQG